MGAGQFAWAAATVYYFGVSGSGTWYDNSYQNPIGFADYYDPFVGDLTAEQNFMYVAAANPADPGNSQVEIRMLPGDYVAKPMSFDIHWSGPCNYPDPAQLAALTNRVLTIHKAPEAPLAEAVTFKMDVDTPNSVGGQVAMLWNGSDIPLARWVIEDITFDGNWNDLKMKAHPGYTAGFKTSALWLKGYTGLIKHVRVRNFGANGVVPGSWVAPASTEAFPIFVHATSFAAAPYAGTTHAWIVEGCEVSDFHCLHGGYATAIMVSVGYPSDVPRADPDDDCEVKLTCTEDATTLGGSIPSSLKLNYGSLDYWYQWADQPGDGAGQRDHRVALVTGCVVRDVPIGLGSVASAGVTFTNNVVLHGKLGANFDTGPIYNVDIRNCAFLDMQNGIANVGGHTWPVTGFRNWNISGNILRLQERGRIQTYVDYYMTNVSGAIIAVSNPNRVLGQIYTNHAEGLTLGGCSVVTFSDNRITTRLLDHFYEPNPSESGNAVFTPVSTPASETAFLWYSGNGWTVNQDPDSLTVSNVKLSSAAFDFLTAGASPLAKAEATSQTAAISASPNGFSALDWFGYPRRVERLADNSGVREVSVTARKQPSGDLYVQARRVKHYSYSADQADSTVESPEGILFRLTDPSGTSSWQQASYGGGVASFTLPAYALVTGPYQINAIVHPPGRTGETFDPDLDYWAETEYLHGNVVRFVRAADIANDRALKKGMLTLRRSGTDALTVYVTPQSSSMPYRDGNPAAHGTDYTLRDASNAMVPYSEEHGAYVVGIASGVSQVSIYVSPVMDDVAESELVYVKIQAGHADYAPAPPGPCVSVRAGVPDAAAVTLYDGAAWRLVALTDYDPYPSVPAYATVATALQDGLTPKIGGYSWILSPNSHYHAGYWVSYWLMTKLASGDQSVQAFGISDSSVLYEAQLVVGVNLGGSGGGSSMAGQGGQTLAEASGRQEEPAATDVASEDQSLIEDRGQLLGAPEAALDLGGGGVQALSSGAQTAAFYAKTSDGLVRALPRLPSSTASAQANGVNPYNAAYGGYLGSGRTWIVGWANPAAPGKTQAARWEWDWGLNDWQISRLGQFQGDPDAYLSYAYAVNDRLNAVGTAEKVVNEGGTDRNRMIAFRTAAGQPISASSALRPFGQVDEHGATYYEYDEVRYYTTNSMARAVNAIGDAVGSADSIAYQSGQYVHRPRACLWTRGSDYPWDLGVLARSDHGEAGDKSEALGVNTHPFLLPDGTWNPNPIGDGDYASLWIEWVGWANLQPGSNAKRAVWGFYYPYQGFWKALYNLNDSHFVQGLGSWCLEEARAINDSGHIVGVGGGGMKAFHLVPLRAP